MPVKMISSRDEFKQIMASKDPVALEFVAPWEKNCKVISNKLSTFADSPKYSHINFYRLDINDQQDAAMDAKMTNITAPTLHFYKNGEQSGSFVGDSLTALERSLASFANGCKQ